MAAVINLGPLAVRYNRFDRAGDFVEGHAHAFDHVTMCTAGEVQLTAVLADGQIVIRVLPCEGMLTILAGVSHRIEALQDESRTVCIYAHRAANGDIVEHAVAWNPDEGAEGAAYG